MSIYSETMSNTPETEIPTSTNCYNCDNDCMGVWLRYIIGDDL